MKIKKTVLIGAGNVGYHLGRELHDCGLEVLQVFSRKITKARKLAKFIGADSTNDLAKISAKADLYLVAVHDDAINSVAQKLPLKVRREKLVVHTSGAAPSTIFKGICKRYGVFYPLQTFSVKRSVDFSRIPICYFANLKKDRTALNSLGAEISEAVYEINDDQRAVLHVAAVFANNFSNQLFNIAEQITQNEQIPFGLLRPLIEETAAKVQHQSPAQMQTGPALRGDLKTIEKHLDYLQQYPEWEKLYRLLSKSIHPKLNL